MASLCQPHSVLRSQIVLPCCPRSANRTSAECRMFLGRSGSARPPPTAPVRTLPHSKVGGQQGDNDVKIGFGEPPHVTEIFSGWPLRSQRQWMGHRLVTLEVGGMGDLPPPSPVSNGGGDGGGGGRTAVPMRPETAREANGRRRPGSRTFSASPPSPVPPSPVLPKSVRARHTCRHRDVAGRRPSAPQRQCPALSFHSCAPSSTMSSGTSFHAPAPPPPAPDPLGITCDAERLRRGPCRLHGNPPRPTAHLEMLHGTDGADVAVVPKRFSKCRPREKIRKEAGAMAAGATALTQGGVGGAGNTTRRGSQRGGQGTG